MKMNRIHWLSLSAFLAATLLTGCEDREAAAAAQAAALAARNEQAAGQAEREFNAAIDNQHWALAKAQADVLLANWPDTEAAARVLGRFDEVKTRAEAEREARRVAALWAYSVTRVQGGQQHSAAIYGKDMIDLDGRGKRPVRLIFRDHPSWGRSSYLVLERGDFARACYRNCQVKVTVDDAAPRNMAANRPDTDEAIAMFINDERALWRRIRGAERLAIEFPVHDGSRHTVVFEVAGLDRSRLPGWD